MFFFNGLNIDAYRFWTEKLYEHSFLCLRACEEICLPIYVTRIGTCGQYAMFKSIFNLSIAMKPIFLTTTIFDLISCIFLKKTRQLRMFLLTTVDFSEHRFQTLFDNEFWKLFWYTIFHTPTFVEIENDISIKND